MSHEAIIALEKIVQQCEGSDNLTRRQISIFDIALEGLGMVYRQRQEIINPWRQKIIQARRDRIMAMQAAQQMTERGLELVA